VVIEKYYIKENSLIAKIAAWKLKSKRCAIVLGKTIHLTNTSKEEFLRDKRWLNHEMCHIQQFKQYGFLKFIVLYLAESFKKGYANNRFEIEARKAETKLKTNPDLADNTNFR